MALHLDEFLLLFGPIHSWWTFPFERMIGALQRMPHNFILGELEATISRAYTRSANLCAIPLKAGCPEVIQQMQKIFKKLVDPQLRNTLQTAMASLGSQVADPDKIVSGRLVVMLPDELIIALKEKHLANIVNHSACYICSTITIHGLTYSTNKKHRGNSCAVLLSPSKSSIPVQIIHIIHSLKNIALDDLENGSSLGRPGILADDILLTQLSSSIDWLYSVWYAAIIERT